MGYMYISDGVSNFWLSVYWWCRVWYEWHTHPELYIHARLPPTIRPSHTFTGIKRNPNDCGVWGHTPWVGCHAVPYETNHLVFFLCHSFNYFWPLNILNWSFQWFWKSIPHGPKIYMAKKHTTWSCGMPLNITWHIPNAVACDIPSTMA